MNPKEGEMSKPDKTQSFVDAVQHPVRREILRLAVERDEKISPTQASRTLDVDLSVVSYHVKVLTDKGVLSLVSTAPTPSSVEHFYTPVSSALEHPIVKVILEEEEACS
jgi:DNA-binding transcriptional ArsR family regulator